LELQSIDEFLERHGDLFEVVLVCRVSVACHLVERIRRHCERASLIFDTIDLHFLRMEREAALTGSAAGQKQALATKALELRVAATADAVIVHSDSELEILQREVPDALSFVVPYVLDARGKWNGYAARKDLLFLGGFRHRPNVDAVQYFVREILPQVRREIPDIRLRIVGSEPTAEVRALASDGVVVSGYVEDLTSVFESTRVMVAPLRYGAGYKGKVAMSLAHGVPPVLTPIAAEGMRLVDGAEVLIADAPKDFARAVVRLYQDESLWELLSCKGLKLVQQRFSRAAVRPIFEQLLATAGVASWDDRRRFLASGRHRLPGRAIFPSRFMRELYQRAGITFEGDALVPHGVRFPDPRPRDVDRSQLIDKTALRLLFAGRIVRFKGAHTAVESLGLIQSRLPHLKVELSIVGDRSDRTYVAELEQLIHEKGLDAAVKFEPAVREDDVSQLFQRHDIYLFPSLFEPFALTLILALEAGIPTVASATGGNFDLIRDHETGILVPPGDPAELAAAVHELTTRPDLRRSISERGRSAARALGLGRMLDGLERALEENTAGSTPDRQVAS
jgi:glycosyltransferase involved in cell wall biosynthesis